MAMIKMVSEEEAEGTVKEIYEEIKQNLGIDFIPNMYRVMAPKPEFLRTTWERIKSVMQRPGKLDTLSKEIVAVTVAVMMGCKY